MLYNEAARIVNLVSDKKGSVKSLTLSSDNQNKKALYALVCQTLKYQPVLQTILDTSKIQKQHKALADTSLACVLLYDFLFGKGLSNSAGPLKALILKHKAALHAELARLKIKAKVTRNEDLLTDKVKQHAELPRYVRVNLLKTSVQGVVEHFRREDFTLMYPPTDYDRFVSSVRGLEKKQFMSDPHLPELLIFAAGTDLHDHVLYRSGDIILQDKASCLPAFILAPPPGSHVIDCCAAPGNKTTHAAAIMKNKGKLYAFDKDPKRLLTMNTLTLRAGVLCATMKAADFLSIDPHDPKYSAVEYTLVDPSCSGSGIVSRLNSATDDADSTSSSRLQQLASFQQSILKHALSFPRVKRLVYSTCSTHVEENENVVASVLEEVGGDFHLVDVLPGLPSRGHEGFHSCVRLSAKHDLTNGFFVACFERLPGATADADSGSRVVNTHQVELETEELAAMTVKPSGTEKTGRKKSKSTVDENVVDTDVAEKPKKKRKKAKNQDSQDESSTLSKKKRNTASSEKAPAVKSNSARDKKRKHKKRHHRPVTC